MTDNTADRNFREYVADMIDAAYRNDQRDVMLHLEEVMQAYTAAIMNVYVLQQKVKSIEADRKQYLRDALEKVIKEVEDHG